eukprot:Em0003g1040a
MAAVVELFAGSCLFLLLYVSTGSAAIVVVPTSLCSNSSDCYPAALNGTSVPTKYINCSNQKCVCSDCFYATNSYKSCAYQSCWEYDKTTQTCNDLRKDQRTAFLLSLFLSALGAANFYIEQYTMAGFQLAILVLLPPLAIALLCCAALIIDRCIPFERWLGGTILIAFLLWVALMVLWWVADLLVFAENERPAGDSCPLVDNL